MKFLSAYSYGGCDWHDIHSSEEVFSDMPDGTIKDAYKVIKDNILDSCLVDDDKKIINDFFDNKDINTCTIHPMTKCDQNGIVSYEYKDTFEGHEEFVNDATLTKTEKGIKIEESFGYGQYENTTEYEITKIPKEKLIYIPIQETRIGIKYGDTTQNFDMVTTDYKQALQRVSEMDKKGGNPNYPDALSNYVMAFNKDEISKTEWYQKNMAKIEQTQDEVKEDNELE